MNTRTRISLDSRLVCMDDISDKRVPAGSELLAFGAAADIWLVDTPDVDVHKCILKVIRMSVEAMKVKCNAQGSRTAEQLWGEFVCAYKSKLNQWEPLAHENVVRVLGVNEALDLRVEYLSRGTASQYLAAHPNDSIPLRKRMIGDVLAGLTYLHSRQPPVIHGSIRMDKLFVDIHGTTKIGEFGLASLVEGFELFVPSILQDNQIRWRSPKLLRANAKARTMESDIWSLGCTLFEIMSGKLPYFRHQNELLVYHALVSNEMPGDLEDLLDPDFVQFWTLATSCWEWIPGQQSLAPDLWEDYLSGTSVLQRHVVDHGTAQA
ncbi:unnamed protein product [Rhizoctonia solani]|uniref:non-specific serine/threonine protein kinase n=1 Tax=Rhizoctonia solani TaxID=456999 RepID=A0A8H3AVG5_9AGAM|nr:unnamed protein product [Rhizoctonia solani]